MVKRKVLKTLTSSVLALSTSLMLMAPNTLAFTPESREAAIQRLNEFRMNLGLQPLEKNEKLDFTAQKHSDYLLHSTDNSHYQNEVNNPYYFGRTVADRIESTGLIGWGYGEGIATPILSSVDAIESLIDAPFHRTDSYHPGHQLVGIGSNKNGRTVVDYTSLVDSYSQTHFIKYPYNNQKDVKVIWYNYENPNPLEPYGGLEKTYLGYPITLSGYGIEVMDIIYQSHSLVDQNGNQVDSYVVHAGNHPRAKNHIFIIPKQPLKFNTTYTVNIKGQIKKADLTTQNLNEEWSFKTIAEPKIDIVMVDNENIFVDFSKTGDIKEYTIDVYDLMGEKVYSNKIINNKSYVYKPVPLVPSIYYYVINSNLLEENIPGYIQITVQNGKYVIKDDFSEQPDEPTQPEQPEEPEIPIEPEQPEEPEIPVEPEQPEEPEIPVVPEQPEGPSEPETPVTPEEPVEEEEPEVYAPVISSMKLINNTIHIQFEGKEPANYSLHVRESNDKFGNIIHARKFVNGRSFSNNHQLLTEGTYYYTIQSDEFETISGTLTIVKENGKYVIESY
ncbi:CAP domain-containing protein [Calidifontibacillus erzurumensis]|uniref:CAP domain-containing protein n=1 Tax=Calidifontibacillus erzurumensis TaxID=2741433 RepID=UPI0035B51E0F